MNREYEEKKKELNAKLVCYVEENIFPRYKRYYGHGLTHIKDVINKCLLLGEYYSLDKNMCYVMAAYHDIGLNVDRDNHEKESGKILFSDANLKTYFDEEQIQIMKEAVEDHRGSRKERPRNFYGEVLSDSDRDFDVALLARRQLGVSLKNYPSLKTFEEHFERSYNYILENKNHISLWTDNEILNKRLEQFKKEFLDKEFVRSVYKKEYEKIFREGIVDKILHYYEDF